MIDLAVFDMAGTTIDDGGAVYAALRGAVTSAGATVSDPDLQTWMGTDKVAAITALLGLGGVEATEPLVESTFAAFKGLLASSYTTNPPVAFAGVEEALATLRSRGIKVALTTGFDRAVVDSLLPSLGWTVGAADTDTVDAIVTTTDVVAGRPAPYMIHHAMELTGTVDVSRVLAAGDTVVDIRAARNAGVIAVGVLTGALSEAELAAEPHDHILSGVAVIPDLPECQPAAVSV
jgi:phosphonatase-like hydrolase